MADNPVRYFVEKPPVYHTRVWDGTLEDAVALTDWMNETYGYPVDVNIRGTAENPRLEIQGRGFIMDSMNVYPHDLVMVNPVAKRALVRHPQELADFYMEVEHG